jgi:hypothetical protein
MRNASETPETDRDVIRTTFEAPRPLINEFRLIAKRNQRTLSGEVRKMIEDAVEHARADHAPQEQAA